MQSLKELSYFQWRYIDGQWFEVKNPPLFSPIALNTSERFANLIIENSFNMDWEQFANTWIEKKEKIKRGEIFQTKDISIFPFSQFIGNLPNLYFTSLTLHHPLGSSQNFFYFGARRRDEKGNTLMPLAAKLHHSSCDPHIFELLLNNYLKRFSFIN